MEKIILTDIDGVILSWDDAFDNFMNRNGFNSCMNIENTYSIPSRYGMTDETGYYFVNKFNESEGIANLKPFADSIEYVEKLIKLGFQFIAVSSVGDKQQTKNYRIQNLQNYFGNTFNEIVCLPAGTNKTEELSRWSNLEYFWIEDNIHQAEAGYNVGLSPILINHSYNFHYNTKLFPTVNVTTPWKEIYSIICNRYNLIV